MAKAKSSTLTSLATLAAVIVLAGGAFFGIRALGVGSSYVAVYTATGDLYFGEQPLLSSATLHNAHLLQVNQQNQQQPLSLQNIQNTFWQPKGTLSLNEDNVIWTAELSGESQVTQFLKGELQPQQAPAAAQNTLQRNQPAGTGQLQGGQQVPQGAQ